MPARGQKDIQRNLHIGMKLRHGGLSGSHMTAGAVFATDNLLI